MQCVQPPLLAKPAKGYGWTCAPCTVNHEERIEQKLARSATPVKPKPAPKGKTSTADGPKARMMSAEDKYFKQWPYRYFGCVDFCLRREAHAELTRTPSLYTFADDTLDPDDMIWPRAATRIGTKYQSALPNYLGPWSETQPMGKYHNAQRRQ